jgi:Flp pilus assembly protein TadG
MARTPTFLKRLKADARGVSAIEFALIAPVMILLYCGMAELSSGIMAARKSGHATSTVGDLVAQATQVSASDMFNLFMAASDVIVPFPAQNSTGGYILLTRASSLSVRNDGSVQVDWSCTPDNPAQSSQLPPLAANTKMTGVPVNLLNTSNPGDSVIETDGVYQFTPPSNWIFPTGLKFQNTYYFKPRRSVSVSYSTTNSGSTAKCNAPS